jgi:hypothetical protein
MFDIDCGKGSFPSFLPFLFFLSKIYFFLPDIFIMAQELMESGRPSRYIYCIVVLAGQETLA